MQTIRPVGKRSGRAVWFSAVVGTIASLTLAFGPAAAETEPSTGTATEGHYGSLADLNEKPEFSAMAVSGVITAGSCKYRQRTDNVHFSGTGFAASAHGWWTKESGTCPSKANVDAVLQAVFCDAFGSCYWRTVDTKSKSVYAGGGSANRSAVRENCAGSKTVGWRVRVDVDLIGVGDPSGWTTSPGKDLACYPSS